MDTEPKPLLYNGKREDWNPLPKVQYKDIPEERRNALRHIRLCKVASEDFEEWLAVQLEFNKIQYKSDKTNLDDMTERLADEEDLKCLAQHFRSEFRHLNESAVWKKENLAPLVQELARIAINDPQYDWLFLYRLERQKLICMEQYLSHSRVADRDGRYIGKKWLVLCIRLLDYILDYMKITKEQIRRMNIRNLHTLVNSQTIENFYKESGDQGMKFSSGKDIYIRKMERLYHMIRINYTRLWWE